MAVGKVPLFTKIVKKGMFNLQQGPDFGRPAWEEQPGKMAEKGGNSGGREKKGFLVFRSHAGGGAAWRGGGGGAGGAKKKKTAGKGVRAGPTSRKAAGSVARNFRSARVKRRGKSPPRRQ